MNSTKKRLDALLREMKRTRRELFRVRLADGSEKSVTAETAISFCRDGGVEAVAGDARGNGLLIDLLNALVEV